MKFYLVDKLDFWSSYFWIVPYSMISLGALTFVVTVFGFLISGSENRALLTVYAILLGICFLLQLGSIFSSLEMRNEIDREEHAQATVSQEFAKYDENNPDVTHIVEKWDYIQVFIKFYTV